MSNSTSNDSKQFEIGSRFLNSLSAISMQLANSSLPNAPTTEYAGGTFTMKSKKLTQQSLNSLLFPAQDTFSQSLGVAAPQSLLNDASDQLEESYNMAHAVFEVII